MEAQEQQHPEGWPQSVQVEEHPELDAACFLTVFSAPLETLEVPAALRAFFAHGVQTPMDEVDAKGPVRDLLRHGGFKPTGRNKPACEYLTKAIDKGWFGPDKGINLAVDACNVVSLHSSLPISVIDAHRAQSPWSIAICPKGTSYVFNPSGQTIDIGGLLSFHDEQGPCGGPVKDSQRTKTHEGTTHTISVIWGTKRLPGRTQQALQWYRQLLHDAGAQTFLLQT